MNARKGRWLDRSTRHDGVKLNCELQALEVMRFVNAEVEEMRQGWEIRRQREWNAHYCNRESWREAIDAGWSIISTLTFRAGEQIDLVRRGVAVTGRNVLRLNRKVRDAAERRNYSDG